MHLLRKLSHSGSIGGNNSSSLRGGSSTTPTPSSSPPPPILDIPPALTFVESLSLPSPNEPQRQDFIQLRRKPSISAVYSLSLFCRVEAYDEWRSTISHKLVFRWRTAKVIDFDGNKALVAFDGYSPRWDMWFALTEGKLRSPHDKGPVSYKQQIYHAMQTEEVEEGERICEKQVIASPKVHQTRMLRAISTTSSLYVEIEDDSQLPAPPHASSFFFAKKEWQQPRVTRGVSGLMNLGNTCYMNSILQSLSYVPPFASTLLETTTPFAWENDIARELCELIREQWKLDPLVARNPERLRSLLARAFPVLFQNNRQQDAQEFLCALLDLLHETNNRIRRKPTYFSLEDFDQEDASLEAWSMYERGNDSFIKDLFCGQFMSRKQCLHCNDTSFACDVFFDLQVPLCSNSDRTTSPSTTLRLEDLLGSYFKTEHLLDVTCGKCKQMGGITRRLTIERFPSVLIIMFKRTLALNKKVQTPVTFPLKGLKILSSGSKVYDLVSVVNHHGDQANAGHYTSDVLHPLSGTWFHANDASFTPHANRNQVGKDAFMLFYVDTDQLVSSEFLRTVVH